MRLKPIVIAITVMAVVGCSRHTVVNQSATKPQGGGQLPVSSPSQPPPAAPSNDAFVPHGIFNLPINPLTELNFKSKAEIYQLRINAVRQHPELLADGGNSYKPSEEIFGQIEDGKPWWGVLGLSYYGDGEKSIEGPAMQSEYILNPFLLVGLNDRVGHRVHDPALTPTDIYAQPNQLSWNLDASEVQITYDISDFSKGLRMIHVDYADQPEMVMVAYNARDLGYPFMYLALESSSHVRSMAPEAPYAIQIPQFVHKGGSCGYPGGCNNYSPSDPALDIKVEELPAVANIKLWKIQEQKRIEVRNLMEAKSTPKMNPCSFDRRLAFPYFLDGSLN